MTRITNFGRKRTYLQAGFGSAGVDEGEQPSHGEVLSKPEDGVVNLPKKPRKRRRKNADATADGPIEGSSSKATSGENRKRDEIHTKAAASEHRRLKRIADRHASTTCLACRKKGHTVKDCTEGRTALDEDGAGAAGIHGRSIVGICYRCGSIKHTLSRCKKPANPKNPLPFASCFVCSEKGHLASSCPQNQGKGIYPNGGSCKLCGQTSHLAKNCELRNLEPASSGLMLGGTRNEGGADEDDFHVLKRRQDAVKTEEAIIRRTANTSAKETAVKPIPKVVVFK
ncbi:hypothetical protein JB92DRAFT_2865113 [Gautieria morchelliformis]|nr:hypothetical protein JB92DRAFT_2865113 [Gautieria morchelliformis]